MPSASAAEALWAPGASTTTHSQRYRPGQRHAATRRAAWIATRRGGSCRGASGVGASRVGACGSSLCRGCYWLGLAGSGRLTGLGARLRLGGGKRVRAGRSPAKVPLAALAAPTACCLSFCCFCLGPLYSRCAGRTTTHAAVPALFGGSGLEAGSVVTDLGLLCLLGGVGWC